MLIISKEQTESRTTCVVQLENSDKYNENILYNVCNVPFEKRGNRSISNIPEFPGCYEVSIKTGWEPYDDIFAKMVEEDNNWKERN